MGPAKDNSLRKCLHVLVLNLTQAFCEKNFWFKLEFAEVQNKSLNLCCRRKLRRAVMVGVMVCFVLTFWV